MALLVNSIINVKLSKHGSFVKTKLRYLFVALTAGLGLMLAGRLMAQTYTFGTQVQSTNTASITYNSGTGLFQYTDAANSSEDTASLPLTGSTTNLITSTNGWHASVTINISAKSLTATGEESPGDGIGLSAFHLKGTNQYYVSILTGQINNTGDATPDFPKGLYGTGAHFLARSNGVNEVTTPLSTSVNADGDSIFAVSGATNASAATESVGAISGVVTLSYDTATEIVMGYYNGTPVGSYSIAGWGTTPALTLYVFGSSGEGIGVTAGADMATNFNAGFGTFSLPQLAAIRSGAGMVIMWPTNATGFTLQSTTNLDLPTGWTTVSPAPVVVRTNNAVTNTISRTQQFYRLSQ